SGASLPTPVFRLAVAGRHRVRYPRLLTSRYLGETRRRSRRGCRVEPVMRAAEAVLRLSPATRRTSLRRGRDHAERTVAEGARAHRRLLAGRQLSLGRPDLSL